MIINNEDTICAIATATGGAIGIIRVSGPDAISIADRIFMPKGKDETPLAGRKAYTMAFGQIGNSGGEPIDEVLVSLFRAPHSYTGEDSVEISCHGSTYILQQVIQLLIDNGCRAAGPGEFTQRAFINGKMDLSQAEAVADLISSSSAAAHRMAMNHMRGGFSHELSMLRDKLLHLTSLMELELDFSDHEELEFADRSELKDIASRIGQVISRLVASFSTGNAIKNGVPVAIIGETNAGKSTLLNALLNEERAIVSDIHGTTRDVIEDTMDINGVTFRFIDTAGIRKTEDEIENLGIERTFQKLSQAEIILLVVDATRQQERLEDIAKQIIPLCKDKQLIVVYNKSDLPHHAPSDLMTGIPYPASDTSGLPSDTSHLSSGMLQLSTNTLPRSTGTFSRSTDTFSRSTDMLPLSADIFPPKTKTISISAKNKTNIDGLKHLLASSINLPAIKQNDIIISNVRHYDALSNALASIRRVQEGLDSQLPCDLISQDLHATLSYLGEIIGENITTNEVLENIFKHFCIGK